MYCGISSYNSSYLSGHPSQVEIKAYDLKYLALTGHDPISNKWFLQALANHSEAAVVASPTMTAALSLDLRSLLAKFTNTTL